MLFVDNARLTLIGLVLFDHAAATYSGVGGWYYHDPVPPGPDTVLLLAYFQALCQSFFMGTLFALAGYYAAAALSRKGPAAFARGRLSRLGLPTLAYVAAIHPLTVYYAANPDGLRSKIGFFGYYRLYVTDLHFLSGTGPMWFALALLVFCLIYAFAAAVLPGNRPDAAPRPLTPGLVGTLVLVCATGAFLVRLAFPVGVTVCNMQLGHFTQYVLLFGFGIAARANDWLRTAEFRLGRGCLLAACAGLPVLWALLVFGARGDLGLVNGGWRWQSLAFALWESVNGVCMTVGIITVLRRTWNTQGPLTAAMSDGAFAVYVFHPPIMVLLARGLAPWQAPLAVKCLALFALSVPACFGAARIIRRMPLLRDLVRQ
jgi:hypothetical protein